MSSICADTTTCSKHVQLCRSVNRYNLLRRYYRFATQYGGVKNTQKTIVYFIKRNNCYFLVV